MILDEELPLKPLSKIHVKIDLPQNESDYSFLDAAMNLDFEGQPDLSENVDKYLYGESTNE